MDYICQGTCSAKISYNIYEEGGVKRVSNVNFYGGCNGNTQGIAKLVEGMPIDEVINRCKGIRCGFKPTSCPDQLAKALEQVK